MKFYTNAQVLGDNILVRGVENGKRFKHRVGYYPTLFLPSNKESKWRTLDGKKVSSIKPGTIRETREFAKKYDGVDNIDI